MLEDFQLLYPLSYLLILLGLLGAVVPILPGSLLIWLGVFAWAYADGFRAFGWPTLLLLGLMVLFTWGSDLLLTTWISRKSGASNKAVWGAIVGGLLGGVLLTSLIPVAGTILGGIAGAIIGVLAVELLVQRNVGQALKSGGSYILGYLASAVVQILLCVAMIGIFVIQAFGVL
jgi:uncharacterized protein YqgC (DUF456 family)